MLSWEAFMKLTRRDATFGGLSFLTSAALAVAANASDGLEPLEGIEDFALATDAYVFGYPLFMEQNI
jgi:hypothetical protein